jgi:hypothetical protein
LAAGAADAGVSAQALAVRAASARAVTNDLFIIGFMEFQSSPFEFCSNSFYCGATETFRDEQFVG